VFPLQGLCRMPVEFPSFRKPARLTDHPHFATPSTYGSLSLNRDACPGGRIPPSRKCRPPQTRLDQAHWPVYLAARGPIRPFSRASFPGTRARILAFLDPDNPGSDDVPSCVFGDCRRGIFLLRAVETPVAAPPRARCSGDFRRVVTFLN